MMTDGDAASHKPCDEVDMSPGAISQRLDEVGQLYELGLYLTQAQPQQSSPPSSATPPVVRGKGP